jgi:hypothetical protein
MQVRDTGAGAVNRRVAVRPFTGNTGEDANIMFVHVRYKYSTALAHLTLVIR